MRIDVHAHLWSERYLDLLVRLGNSRTAVHRGLGAGATDDELRKRFDLMDAAGIRLQILSVTPASPHFEQRADAVEAARLANDEYAAMTRRFPDRFRAFAALPLPHTEAALAELGRSFDELGMVGAAVTTSVLGRPLSDVVFHPIYAELNRRKSVLYIHPAGCGAESPLINEHRMVWSVGAPIEDTIVAANDNWDHADAPAPVDQPEVNRGAGRQREPDWRVSPVTGLPVPTVARADGPRPQARRTRERAGKHLIDLSGVAPQHDMHVHAPLAFRQHVGSAHHPRRSREPHHAS